MMKLCAAPSILLLLVLLSSAQASKERQEAPPPELVKLRDKDPLVRIEAILEINRSNISRPKAAAALIDCILDDDNIYVREIASDVLSSLRSYAKDSVPQMIGIVKDPAGETNRRARAAEVLGAIGVEARESIFPLVEVLENTNQPSLLRQSAAIALLNFGPLPADVVSRIESVAFASRESPRLRLLAMRALATSGRDAVSAIPRLSSVLNDSDTSLNLREEAAHALGAIGNGARVGYPAKVLTQILRNETEKTELRVAAADAIQAIGPTAGDALPALRDLAVNREQPLELRLAALDALQRVGQGAHSISVDLARVAATPGDDILIRIKAAIALGSAGPGPAQVEEMVNLAQDLRETKALRRAALDAIRPENTAVKGVTAALIGVLSNPKQDPEVRRQASQILAQVKPVPTGVVPEFIAILGNPNAEIELRRGVVYSVEMAGVEAVEAVPVLVQILRDSPDLILRRRACEALMDIRRNGEGLVSTLETILRDDDADSELRRTAVLALGAVGSDDKTVDLQVVSFLLDILKNAKDPQMRENATAYLGQMEVDGTDAVSVLGRIVANEREDTELRTRAASALGAIAENQDVSQTLPVMLRVLQNDQEQTGLRQAVANALPHVQPRAQDSISALIRVIQESDDPQIRAAAANALGIVGEGSKPAAVALAAILTDKRQGNSMRSMAAQALGRTGVVATPYLHLLLEALNDEEISYSALQGFVSYSEQAIASGDIDSLSTLEQAEAAAATKPTLASMPNGNGGTYLAQLQRSIAVLQTEASRRKKTAMARLTDYAVRHWLISFCLAGFLLRFLYCVLLFVFKPISLLKSSDRAVWLEREKIPANFNFVTIPLSWFYYPFMRFHPKSLDAWVQKKTPKVRSNFAILSTVAERELYVDLPVRINAEIDAHFRAESLQETFRESRTTIVVMGEGGAGKTSVACQVGRWALASRLLAGHFMVPILIEGDISNQTSDSINPFQETIRGRLGFLLSEPSPSKPMLESLLRHKRALVIVDGFSEMSEASQATIRTADPAFPVHALLITSRSEKPFPATRCTVIEPERLEKGSLGTFMERYLKKLGKSNLFTRREFQTQAGELQQLVGDREVTVLFAKLYLDLLVSSKDAKDGKSLPANVPGLILEYLNYLNRNLTTGGKENYEVQQLAKAVACQCVRPNFRPSPAKIDDVLQALGGGASAKESFSYLEKRLVLVQFLHPGEEVRFILDPLAEYLAAIGLVDENQGDEGKWRAFLHAVDKTPEAPLTIRGFLEAVADSYLSMYPSATSDDYIVREIHARLSEG